ncbi:MAG: outer membrane beta-barrel protein [Calditrichae bacterium]|nr:outer membrane beta-barrel protein [Calditrichia bacterium]
MKLFSIISMACIVFMMAGVVSAQSSGSWGIRGGVGTDISGGIAFGGSINYLFPSNQNHWEIGPVLYISSSEETTTDYNTYTEKTDLTVFGVMANYLINYEPEGAGTFFLVGLGLAGVSVEWEESSPDDESLGTPLPGGGSKQSEDGTAGGSVLNIGAGYKFSGNVDIRAELPIILIFGAPGNASSVVPTLTATVGIRF